MKRLILFIFLVATCIQSTLAQCDNELEKQFRECQNALNQYSTLVLKKWISYNPEKDTVNYKDFTISIKANQNYCLIIMNSKKIIDIKITQNKPKIQGKNNLISSTSKKENPFDDLKWITEPNSEIISKNNTQLNYLYSQIDVNYDVRIIYPDKKEKGCSYIGLCYLPHIAPGFLLMLGNHRDRDTVNLDEFIKTEKLTTFDPKYSVNQYSMSFTAKNFTEDFKSMSDKITPDMKNALQRIKKEKIQYLKINIENSKVTNTSSKDELKNAIPLEFIIRLN